MIVTDWADINNLYTREKVAKDKKDAIRIAINAGIDMSMDPYSVEFCQLLKELVQEGKVSMDRIDDAVRRILRVKYRLGLFDEPNTGGKGFEKFGCKEWADASLRAAEESEVLLKNDGILPLAKGKKMPTRCAVFMVAGATPGRDQGLKISRRNTTRSTRHSAISMARTISCSNKV